MGSTGEINRNSVKGNKFYPDDDSILLILLREIASRYFRQVIDLSKVT
jgi:hypothetical protein